MQDKAQFEKIILDLNKNGMEFLSQEKYRQAHELLRKAEKLVEEYLRTDPKDQRTNQLAGITYNNLGCYYKKTDKPKVALGYLKAALQLQVYNVQDWISTAGTHLNMCAIFSYIGRHQQASDHANLSVRLLERQLSKQAEQTQNSSIINILMISYYNLGVEMEYLRNLSQANKAYRKGLDIARKYAPNKNMCKVLQENAQRTQHLVQQNEQRMSIAMERKRESELKGYHDFIRKNKKNDPNAEYVVVRPLGKRLQQVNSVRARYMSTNQMRKGQSEIRLYPRAEFQSRKVPNVKTAAKTSNEV